MTWHRVAELDEVPAGQGKEILVAGRIVALFHVDEDWYALDGMCAHQGGPIARGVISGNCVTCPWHGWQYDLGSGCNLLSGKKMLDCFPVEQRHDGIWLELV
ncbi:MAG: Rieske (2Fe-2S) protein [Planctomycetales bacterium]|nr:Rieske (2Fe-2S) protein [Planctomycetales bacterium]